MKKYIKLIVIILILIVGMVAGVTIYKHKKEAVVSGVVGNVIDMSSINCELNIVENDLQVFRNSGSFKAVLSVDEADYDQLIDMLEANCMSGREYVEMSVINKVDNLLGDWVPKDNLNIDNYFYVYLSTRKTLIQTRVKHAPSMDIYVLKNEKGCDVYMEYID